MKNRVLLINRGSDTDNYGDQAINYTLKKLFEANKCFVDCENYTKFYTRKKNIIVSILINLKEMISIVKNKYDIVCIGGGQLILGNKSFPLSFFLWILIIKCFSNSRIVLFAIGVDSNFNKRQKWLIKKGLYYSNYIYVRDEVSGVNLKRIFGIEVKTVPDVVCVISKFYKPEKIRETGENNLVLFGITEFKSIKRYKYMDLSTEKEYFENQANLLMKYSKASEVKLIYNTKEDYLCTVRFKDYLLKTKSLNLEINNCGNLFEFIDTIIESKLVISSRMHALIISGSYEIEFIPIIRNRKLEVFSNEYIPFKNVDYYYKQIQNNLSEILSK